MGKSAIMRQVVRAVGHLQTDARVFVLRIYKRCARCKASHERKATGLGRVGVERLGAMDSRLAKQQDVTNVPCRYHGDGVKVSLAR